jgi:hypothetical protein
MSTGDWVEMTRTRIANGGVASRYADAKIDLLSGPALILCEIPASGPIPKFVSTPGTFDTNFGI